jgi:hypothetical protein
VKNAKTIAILITIIKALMENILFLFPVVIAIPIVNGFINTTRKEKIK